MSPHEKALFQLGESLSTPVYKLKEMPTSEYFGWLRFYRERSEEIERQQEVRDGNLLAGSTDDLVRAMTNGKR